MGHSVTRFNSTEKQRFQVGLLPEAAHDLRELLSVDDWFEPRLSYVDIHSFMKDYFEDGDSILKRVRLCALQGHSNRSVQPSGIMSVINSRNDMKVLFSWYILRSLAGNGS